MVFSGGRTRQVLAIINRVCVWAFIAFCCWMFTLLPLCLVLFYSVQCFISYSFHFAIIPIISLVTIVIYLTCIA